VSASGSHRRARNRPAAIRIGCAQRSVGSLTRGRPPVRGVITSASRRRGFRRADQRTSLLAGQGELRRVCRPVPACLGGIRSGCPPSSRRSRSSRPVGSRSALGSWRESPRGRDLRIDPKPVDAEWTRAFESCAAWPTLRGPPSRRILRSRRRADPAGAVAGDRPLIVGRTIRCRRSAAPRSLGDGWLGIWSPHAVRRGARSTHLPGADAGRTRASSSMPSTSGAARDDA